MKKCIRIASLLILFITIFNCTKDDNYISESVQKSKLNIERLDYIDLLSDKDIAPILTRLENKLKRGKNFQNQSERSVIVGEGLVILDNEIAKITIDNTITWTFMVESPTHETSDIENFMIKKHNGEFTYFLIKYEENAEINGEIYKVTLEALNGDALDTSSLDLSLRDAFDWEDGNGGETGDDCEGILVYDNCNLGGNADGHSPVLQNNGSYCNGSPLLYIDFSHCENYGVPDGPTGDPVDGSNNPNDTDLSGGSSPNDSSNADNSDSTITTLVDPRCPNGGVIDEDGNCVTTWDENIILYDYIADPKISDIEDYLKCFDTIKSASFTIFVDQPTANSSDTWSGWPTSPDVGHTFISITQDSITRILGFYPAGGVNPFTSPSANSALHNNENHEFDVSLTTDISASQLSSIVGSIKNFNPTYNLNTYNCTDFGLEMANSLGLNIPDTNGTWPGGGGSNPGNLGQDIRGLSTGTGVTKDMGGGNAPSNNGGC